MFWKKKLRLHKIIKFFKPSLGRVPQRCEDSSFSFSFLCLCFAFETLSLVIVCALFSLALSISKRCLRTALTKQNQQTTPILLISGTFWSLVPLGAGIFIAAIVIAIALRMRMEEKRCNWNDLHVLVPYNTYIQMFLYIQTYVCQLANILKCCVCLQCDFCLLATINI